MTFVPSESLTEQIAQYLGNQIVTGELKAGDRIQELRVADELNVSRGSVREALLRPASTPFVPLVDACARDLGLLDDPRVLAVSAGLLIVGSVIAALGSSLPALVAAGASDAKPGLSGTRLPGAGLSGASVFTATAWVTLLGSVS